MSKEKFDKLPKGTIIMLQSSFREKLVKKAIEKAGSMCQLGKILGYTGNAPNWSIKQILYGRQGIPLFRLERLCKFMNVPLTDLESYVLRIGSKKSGRNAYYRKDMRARNHI